MQGGIPGQAGHRAEKQAHGIPTQIEQGPRGHEPVPAVVAGTAHDQDLPGLGPAPGAGMGQGATRGFHQDDPGDPGLPNGLLVQGRHLGGRDDLHGKKDTQAGLPSRQAASRCPCERGSRAVSAES